MPLMQINCKPTGGLADHRDFISNGISSCLEINSFSDLTFICRNRALSSHQSMIGPLSPMLSGLFQQLNCCNCQGSYCGRKEVIQVHLVDTEPQCMENILSLIYTGKVTYNRQTHISELKECLNLLDIKIDLQIDQVELSEVITDTGLGFKVTSVVSYSKSVSDVSNRSLTPAEQNNHQGGRANNRSLSGGGGHKRKITPPVAGKGDAKRMKPEPSKSVEMQMVMLQELRKLDIGVSIACRMPRCGQPINLNQMTKHFQHHIMAETTGQSADFQIKEQKAKTLVTFPCNQCGKQFKFRRALDVHIKNNHKVMVTLPKSSLEDSLKDQISDSDSEPHVTLEHFSTQDNNKSSKIVEDKESKCPTCNKILKSEWHKPPFRHDCESIKNIVQETDRSLVCDLCNQTVESLWYKPPLRHFCPKIPSTEYQGLARIQPLNAVEVSNQYTNESSSDGPVVPAKPSLLKQQLYQEKCNICNRVFANEKSLKIHKNLAHNVGTSMAQVGNGNNLFSALDKSKYQTSDVSNAKKILMSSKSTTGSITNDKFFCQLCSKGFPEFKTMKTHYTFDHFWSNLTKQYGKWDTKCHICDKIYPTKSHLLQHMGNFHGSITIDRYLETDKYQVLTSENSVKLISFNCEICKMVRNNSADLKSHLSTKHFSRQLITEFSVGETKCKKCPKCGKLFDRSGSASTIAAHLGSFHDEVLKYALPYVKMDEHDKALVAVDDFEDGVDIVENTNFQSGISILFKCQLCKEEMKDREGLKIHYQQYHYNEQFKKMYPITDCNICTPPMKFDKDWTLHRHIAVNHEFVLQTLLTKDGINLPSPPHNKKIQKSPKKKSETYGCLICSNMFDSKDGLKMHYYREHFSQYFDNIYTNKQCCFCGKVFIDIDKAQKHIATKHENVLNNLLSKEKQGFSLPWKEELGLKKKKNHKGSVFDYLASEPVDVLVPCQKCTWQFRTVSSLKMHYVTHYWDELKTSHGCKFCSDPCDVSDTQGIREHMVEKHEPILLELMGREGLFTGKCKHFEIGETIKLKEVKVQLTNCHFKENNYNKVDNDDVHANAAEDNKKCPIFDCEVTSDSRNNFLTHLMDAHFWTNLQQDFGNSYINQNKICPICKKVNEDGLEKTYLKHIAVDHEQVMKYVQTNMANVERRQNMNKIETAPQMPSKWKTNISSSSMLDVEGILIPEIVPKLSQHSAPIINPTPILMKKENNESSIIDSDEDPDDPIDPSYVPSAEEEEEAVAEVKSKGEISIKDINTLLKPSVSVANEPGAGTNKENCKCRNCGRMFESPYKMQTHQRNCKWTCTKCNNSFSLQSEFSSHIGTCAGSQTINKKCQSVKAKQINQSQLINDSETDEEEISDDAITQILSC